LISFVLKISRLQIVAYVSVRISGSSSQSVRTTESGGIAGYDAGKKIKGRKRHIFADGGYAGPKLRGALHKVAKFTVQVVKRTDKANGFKVLPRRWVVERTFA
jgi:hypothetical protein